MGLGFCESERCAWGRLVREDVVNGAVQYCTVQYWTILNFAACPPIQLKKLAIGSGTEALCNGRFSRSVIGEFHAPGSWLLAHGSSVNYLTYIIDLHTILYRTIPLLRLLHCSRSRGELAHVYYRMLF